MKRDRDYFASPRGVGNAAGGNYPFEKFMTIETLNPANPRELVPGKAVVARLHSGESAESRDARRLHAASAVEDPSRSPVRASKLERNCNQDRRDGGLVRKQSRRGFREAWREPFGTDVNRQIAKEGAMDRSGSTSSDKTMSGLGCVGRSPDGAQALDSYSQILALVSREIGRPKSGTRCPR